jgi:hypothetical protein
MRSGGTPLERQEIYRCGGFMASGVWNGRRMGRAHFLSGVFANRQLRYDTITLGRKEEIPCQIC